MKLPDSVAIICNIREKRPSIGGHMALALQALGVKADVFYPNKEPDGWDHYLYIDQWSRRGRKLVQKQPSTFWAVDMIVPQDKWRGSLETYTQYARMADRAFVAHLDSRAYLKEHGVNAQWLPLAADPDYHRPWLGQRLTYDAIALYHNCQNRLEYSAALRASDFRQLVAWRDGHSYSEWMCRAKCALNVSRSNELVLRVFEVMAMGVPLVTDRARDLDVLFEEGTHYLGFDDSEEMLSQIDWVGENPNVAQAMAKRARALVLQRHTYYHRVMQIFNE